MVKSRKNIVVDTNVLISAILFGGKPRKIITLILEGKFRAYTSLDLLSEAVRILKQKFQFSEKELYFVENKIKKNLITIYPKKRLKILEDEPDNRVLEVAAENNCNYIITGDKELLKLKRYKSTKIVNTQEFLKEVKT